MRNPKILLETDIIVNGQDYPVDGERWNHLTVVCKPMISSFTREYPPLPGNILLPNHCILSSFTPLPVYREYPHTMVTGYPREGYLGPPLPGNILLPNHCIPSGRISRSSSHYGNRIPSGRNSGVGNSILSEGYPSLLHPW